MLQPPPTQGRTMQTYDTIKTTDTYHNDHNQCTVIASSLAFDVDYKEMTDYYSKQGRRKGKGVQHHKSVAIVKGLAKIKGYDYKRLDTTAIARITKGKTMTVNNSEKYLRKDKTYVLFTATARSGHALAMVNGIVEDHTRGRKHKIHTVIELTPPKDKVLQPVKVEEEVSTALSELTELMLKF